MNIIKNKRGFFAIEAVIGTAVILGVVVFSVLIFINMMERNQLQTEVMALGQIASAQGGLKQTDIEQFRTNLINKGFNGVSVEGRIVGLNGAMHTAQQVKGEFHVMNISDTAYVTTEDKAIIELTVKIGRRDGSFNNFLSRSNRQTLTPHYEFKEKVVSMKRP